MKPKKLMERIKDITALGITAGIFGSLGYGCYSLATHEIPVVHPDDHEYVNRPVQVEYFRPHDNDLLNGTDALIWDVNTDGIADGIGHYSNAKWYSEDWDRSKNFNSIQMTPEIRAAATEVMNSSHKLSKLLTESEFERFEKAQKK